MPFVTEERRYPSADGPIRFAAIPWDSQTYGFPFYELRCQEIDPQILARHLARWLDSLSRERALVFAKIPIDAVGIGHVLCVEGKFYPVETMLELYLPMSRLKPPITRPLDRFKLRVATKDQMPTIGALASRAFSADRLHADPALPPEKANQRFQKWVERGFEDGDRMFAYEDTKQQKLIGFFHVREIGGGTVDLSLGAVDPAFHNLGLGAQLYEAVLLDCRQRGDQLAITHITVNNLEVMNLFSRLGFLFRKPVMTFHRMLP